MSSESLPTRSEVMGWNSACLADYLKRMRLVGCDKVVNKNNMSGAKFLNMTDKDLKKFPTAHIPYITKICKDINQNNKQARKPFFKEHRSQQQKPPKQASNIGGWDSDEFDQEESDCDYEEPDVNDHEDNYICADTCNFEEDNEDYEPPPSEQPMEIPSHFRAAQPLGDGDYLDSGPRVSCDAARSTQNNKSTSLFKGLMNIPKPPSRPDASPHRPVIPSNKFKPGPALPMIDRSTKPGSSFLSKKDSSKSERSGTNSLPMTIKTAALPIPKFNMQQRTDGFPSPPVLPDMMMDQDMDPKWYVGGVTRGEAEVSLRRVNKDGSFLVRDSSKGCTDQPYTLMVLHQYKVYNIQIRFLGNNDGYSLGTGLKGIENFPSVTDMITHHMRTPLILIDGMERETGPPRQCCLIHPAGF